MGLKLGYWEKFGHNPEVGSLNIYFKDSADYGTSYKITSKDWWVWKINDEQEHVGPLPKKFLDAEIGVVVPPDSLVHRMKTGFYDFSYPNSFEEEI